MDTKRNYVCQGYRVDVAHKIGLLAAVLARFDELARHHKVLRDKHLALALGVQPPQVKRWRELVARSDPHRGPNQATIDAITSLTDPGGAWGLDAAAHQVRTTLRDIEGAAMVRRELSSAIGPTGDERDVAALVLAALTGETRRRQPGHE